MEGRVALGSMGSVGWMCVCLLAFLLAGIQPGSNEGVSGGGLGFGSYCVSTAECVEGSHLVCIEEHGRCDCHPDMFYNSSIRECYVLAGKDCSKNSNCIQNSTCSEGVCKCKEDFMSTTEGICLLRYDALCDGSWPCNFDVGLECSEPSDPFTPRQCKCKFPEKDYFSWSKTEEKCVAHVGTNCLADDNCGENSFCNDNGFCECNDNHLITADKKCIEWPSDGETDLVQLHSTSCNATIKEHCKFSEYFTCITKGCDCDFPKLKFWSEKNQCRRLVGEECGLSEQAGQIFPCTKYAECIGSSWQSTVGICHCSEGFAKTKDNKCASQTHKISLNSFLTLFSILLLASL